MLRPRLVGQGALFYDFNIEVLTLEDHLLRSIDLLVDLSGVCAFLASSYGLTSRLSIDAELMIRMPIVKYTHGIGSKWRLCEEFQHNIGLSLIFSTGYYGSVSKSFYFFEEPPRKVPQLRLV